MSTTHCTTAFTALILVACSLAAAACSSRELYQAGQQWQKNECAKLPATEQERCRRSTAMSFEEYQRQAGATKAGQ